MVGNDGRCVQYHLGIYYIPHQPPQYLLSKIARSHSYETLFFYGESDNPTIRLLTGIQNPEGRFKEVSYYKKGEDQSNKVTNRVKSISAPVGNHSGPIVTR